MYIAFATAGSLHFVDFFEVVYYTSIKGFLDVKN